MPKKLKVTAYALVWNEIRMLPYYFRHYDSIVDHYVIYDHDSDDGTQDLLDSHPKVERRHFTANNQGACESAKELKNECWKECRGGKADLVLVCDIDELLYHPRLLHTITTAYRGGYSIFEPVGYSMVSQEFPTTPLQIYYEIQQGFQDGLFTKSILFDPNALEEINYHAGCHQCHPTGDVEYFQDEELKLLHFKYLGIEYTVNRYAELNNKLTAGDKGRKLGIQYSSSRETLENLFAGFQLSQII